MADDIKTRDLTGEFWRSYNYGGKTVQIKEPNQLEYREGGTTHTVHTSDFAYIVPAPGFHGCYILVCKRRFVDAKPGEKE